MEVEGIMNSLVRQPLWLVVTSEIVGIRYLNDMALAGEDCGIAQVPQGRECQARCKHAQTVLRIVSFLYLPELPLK